jgi:hypothetical protein
VERERYAVHAFLHSQLQLARLAKGVHVASAERPSHVLDLLLNLQGTSTVPAEDRQAYGDPCDAFRKILNATQVLKMDCNGRNDVQFGYGRWYNVMFYGPSLASAAAVRAALLQNKKGCRQLRTEVRSLRTAEPVHVLSVRKDTLQFCQQAYRSCAAT